MIDSLRQNTFIKKIGFNRIVLCIVLMLMYGIFCVTARNFTGLDRIYSALNYVYFLGFLSLGVTFVIATGGIDFSIGPVMFCSALISGYCLTRYGFPLIISLPLRQVLIISAAFVLVILLNSISIPNFCVDIAVSVVAVAVVIVVVVIILIFIFLSAPFSASAFFRFWACGGCISYVHGCYDTVSSKKLNPADHAFFKRT